MTFEWDGEAPIVGLYARDTRGVPVVLAYTFDDGTWHCMSCPSARKDVEDMKLHLSEHLRKS